MRFAMLSALAVVALSLISTDTLASPINRKFHPVVNDDPQNAHLNVQTPGADINQTVVISEEPGPDGQVIPGGDTKVASCVAKDSNGDIDLSGGGACSSSAASAHVAEQATAPTIARASSPIPRAASRTPVPSLASASVAPAGNANETKAAPKPAEHAIEAVRAAAPLPTHRTEGARVAAASLPVKQLAPAAQVGAGPYGMTSTQWLEIAVAAAMLFALGLGLILRMGLAGLLRIRRDEDYRKGEERTARSTASAVAHDPLPSP